MAASEIGFNRDAFGCPSVREADGTVGVGPHRPSGYCNLEPLSITTSSHPPELPARPPPRHPHMPRVARLLADKLSAHQAFVTVLARCVAFSELKQP
jgi:hypothetical protein